MCLIGCSFFYFPGKNVCEIPENRQITPRNNFLGNTCCIILYVEKKCIIINVSILI